MILISIFLFLLFIAPCCKDGKIEYKTEAATIIYVIENTAYQYGGRTTVQWSDSKGRSQRYVMAGIIGKVEDHISIFGKKESCEEWVWTSYYKE